MDGEAEGRGGEEGVGLYGHVSVEGGEKEGGHRGVWDIGARESTWLLVSSMMGYMKLWRTAASC